MSEKKDASRRNIAAMARELAPIAMEKLKALMDSESETVAKDACIHILDRAVGKPSQAIVGGDDDDNPIKIVGRIENIIVDANIKDSDS